MSSLPCCLYRHFSAADELLYIGISIDGYSRTRAHAKHSHWFPDVARVQVEHLASREAAIKAERLAIETEAPRFNVVHNARSATGPTRANVSERDLERRIVSFRPIYRIEEASKALNLGPSYIKREMDEGRLGFIEVGAERVSKTGSVSRRRMITGWQLIDWIEAQEALVAQLDGLPSPATLLEGRQC